MADWHRQDTKELYIQADQEQIETASQVHYMGVWVSFVFIYMYYYLYRMRSLPYWGCGSSMSISFPCACETDPTPKMHILQDSKKISRYAFDAMRQLYLVKCASITGRTRRA